MKRVIYGTDARALVSAPRPPRVCPKTCAATGVALLGVCAVLLACTGSIDPTGSGAGTDSPPGSASGGGGGSTGTTGPSSGGSQTGSMGQAGQGGGAASSGGREGGTAGGTSTPEYTDPGRVVMHRLNTFEYNNTVHELLDTSIKLPDAFPPDDAAYGFDNVAATLSLTDTHVGYYFDTAKALATEALTASRRAKLLACDLKAQQEACVTSTLQAFLPRAWRRTVSESDITPLTDLYRQNRAGGSSEDEAFGRVLQAVLLSPRFLFRIEVNKNPNGGARDLDGYELASRLSYFLWSSMPDKTLFDAAAANRLSTPADVQAQITRMLADPRAKALQNFGEQWLSVRNLQTVTPDSKAFPTFDEDLRSAMRQETMLLFNDLIVGKESIDKLLTSDFTYLNDRLAKHYGLPAVGSATPVRTTLASTSHRGGLLTQGGWLSVYARGSETNPVKRGNWILDQTLCIEVQPPMFMVPAEPPQNPGQTRRERLEAHVSEPVCAACHQLMDPPGLALEQYDAVGAYRTQQNGVTIRVDGALPDGTIFSDATDMAKKISQSALFPRCVARHMFIYALGRADRKNSMDSNVLDSVTATFVSTGKTFPKLLEGIATSDVFRKRQDAN